MKKTCKVFWNAQVALLALSLLLAACTGGPGGPAALTVTPQSGPAGTIVTLTGVALDADDVFEVWVGPEQAPARLQTDGSISAALPLYLGSNGWPAPPAGPQAIEVRHGSTILAQSKMGVTITELARAPGSVRGVQESLVTITDAYEGFFAALPVTHPDGEPLRAAVIAMLRGLISEGDHALAGVLAGTSPLLEGAPAGVELLDALLASSGALQYYEDRAGLLQGAAHTAELQLQAGGRLCREDGAAFEIACLMQAQALLEEFSRTVVKPTAAGYANTVGIIMGFSGILGKVGPVQVESADLVTLFSFDESVVRSEGGELEWRGLEFGEVRVRAMPRGPGERSKILRDHALCPDCVWSGGAFGTDMPESNALVIVGDVNLTAFPYQGKAPLEVGFNWTGVDAPAQPVPCTLDLGDGSPLQSFADCAAVTSHTHTYPFTSRLNNPAGAYNAVLSLTGTSKRATTEVLTEWTFNVAPGSGQVPLKTTFTWSIPWPAGGSRVSCTLDPGDGGAQQAFPDCLTTKQATYTYLKQGSFVPALTISSDGEKNTKTSPVSTGGPVGECQDLLKYRVWQGTISYSYNREVSSDREKASTSQEVNLTGELVEDNRSQFLGSDYLVRYYSSDLHGSPSVEYSRYKYSSDGTLDHSRVLQAEAKRFPGMFLNRHIAFIVNRDCEFKFHLQGDVNGISRIYWRGSGEETIAALGGFSSTSSEFTASVTPVISGSAAFPVLTSSQIHDNSFEKPCGWRRTPASRQSGAALLQAL